MHRYYHWLLATASNDPPSDFYLEMIEGGYILRIVEVVWESQIEKWMKKIQLVDLLSAIKQVKMS